MVPSPFAVMRIHWKKSTLFLTTSGSALYYYYDYTISNDLLRLACRKASLLGDAKLKHFAGQPRHITVILNPVAGKRKSKKLYSKWVEPLLHLAGIKVSLIETETPNQAYELMKVMSNCDGVAIVGGDGTVHEAINGLLHRPDCLKAVRDYPIGIMPTGQYNSIARLIHQGFQYRNQKEFLVQATLKLIEATTQKYDVLKITPLDSETDDSAPVYALRDVRCGKYQDNFYKVSGYPFYQNYIKPYWLRLQRMFNDNFPKFQSISYTDPCIGCSKCFDRHKLKVSSEGGSTPDISSSNRRWWSMIAPVSRANSGPSDEEKKEMELAQRDNPNCGSWTTLSDISGITDIRACQVGNKIINLSLGRGGEYSPSLVLEAQDVRMQFSQDIDDEKRLASQAKLVDKEDNNSAVTADQKKVKGEEDKTVNFLIDGQPSQAHSIEITTLSKALTIFTA